MYKMDRDRIIIKRLPQQWIHKSSMNYCKRIKNEEEELHDPIEMSIYRYLLSVEDPLSKKTRSKRLRRRTSRRSILSELNRTDRDKIQQLVGNSAVKYLPEDIIFEIILRLPAKHALRLRVVSKAWNAIIQEEGFAERHSHASSLSLHNDRQQRPGNLLIHYSNFRWTHDDLRLNYHLCPHHEGSTLHLVELDTHGGRANKMVTEFGPLNSCYATIVGSCNGLLCLTGENGNTVRVWNPLANKSMILPPPPKGRQFIIGFGFLHDTRKSEYKLLSVNEYTWLSEPKVMEVLTIPMKGIPGPWRTTGPIPPGIFARQNSRLVNNRLHWLATENDDTHEISRIIAFDMEDEQFRIVPSLNLNPRLRLDEATLTELEGRLSIFRKNGHINRVPTIEVWVMEDYDRGDSWIKRFSVNCQMRIDASHRLEVIKSADDELLIGDGMRLTTYNYKTHQLYNFSNKGFDLQVFGFVGNLSSPASFEAVTI